MKTAHRSLLDLLQAPTVFSYLWLCYETPPQKNMLSAIPSKFPWIMDGPHIVTNCKKPCVVIQDGREDSLDETWKGMCVCVPVSLYLFDTYQVPSFPSSAYHNQFRTSGFMDWNNMQRQSWWVLTCPPPKKSQLVHTRCRERCMRCILASLFFLIVLIFFLIKVQSFPLCFVYV